MVLGLVWSAFTGGVSVNISCMFEQDGKFQPEVPARHLHCESEVLPILQSSDFLAAGERMVERSKKIEQKFNCKIQMPTQNKFEHHFARQPSPGELLGVQGTHDEATTKLRGILICCLLQVILSPLSIATWRTTSPTSTTTTPLRGVTDGAGLCLKTFRVTTE